MGKISKALEKSNSGFSESFKQADKKNADERSPSTTDILESNQSESILTPANNSLKRGDKTNLKAIDNNLIVEQAPTSVGAEQFRLLKNNILFPETGMPPKSIMITSPSPGEGKSFVASNLAISIANSIDEYVLLVDCDLRKPTIHSVFGLPGKAGLSEYLAGTKQLPDLLLKTFNEKLTVLPAGSIPDNPSELLSSGKMRNLIMEMTLRYHDRYIIIDTPPPYITSEASAIARHVDGIIIVVRNGKTRKKDVENIIDIYGKDKIIGAVQNFAEKRPGYGYGYYKYGYGYSHGN